MHSDHYDSYTSGSGNGEEHVPFPITPPVSDQCPGQIRELTHRDDDADEPPRKKVYTYIIIIADFHLSQISKVDIYYSELFYAK